MTRVRAEAAKEGQRETAERAKGPGRKGTAHGAHGHGGAARVRMSGRKRSSRSQTTRMFLVGFAERHNAGSAYSVACCLCRGASTPRVKTLRADTSGEKEGKKKSSGCPRLGDYRC
jgi:hypothetical protein